MKFEQIVQVWRAAAERCIECTLRLTEGNTRSRYEMTGSPGL
jgi:hypothetical protein